jgi:PST family polysaccharide transporter
MKNLLKASLITGSAFFINLVFNVIRAKFVAIILGPSGTAVLAQLGGFTSLVITISSFGLAAAIVRYIAEYKATHRQRDLKVLITTVTLYTAALSLIITLAMLLLLPLVSHMIFGKEILLGLIALSLLNIPISVVTNFAVSILQGLKEIKLDAFFSVFSTIVTGVLLIALLIPFGLTGAVVGMLVSNYLTSAIFFVFVYRALQTHLEGRLDFFAPGKLGDHFHTSALRPLIGIAVASLAGGGITNLTDILVRSHLIHVFGLAIAGGVQPALSFSSQYTGLLGGAVSTYAIPRLSELSQQKELFQKEYQDYSRLVLLSITPFAIAVAVMAQYLVPILYSPLYAVSIPLIPLQSIADVIEFGFIGLAGALLPMGRGKILLLLGVGIPMIYYASYRLLQPFIGLKAIPVASGIGWLLASVIAYIVLRSVLKLSYGRRNFWLLGNSLLAVTIVALSINHLTWLLGAILSIVALAIWARLNITRRELGQLSAMIGKRFGSA